MLRQSVESPLCKRRREGQGNRSWVFRSSRIHNTLSVSVVNVVKSGCK